MFFAIFGLGGVILSITILPLIRLAPVSEKRKRLWGLNLVRRSFFWFTRGIHWTRSIHFETTGQPSSEPCLYVANHPSLLDVVAALGQIPNCNCLVKKSLFRNKFIGSVLATAGLLPNDAGPFIIEMTRREFAKGNSVMVFPEGTRSPYQGMNPFSRGAAQIAVRNRVPIAPILITCEPPYLLKGKIFSTSPDRQIHFHIQFFPPLVLPPEIESETTLPLKVRKLNRFLEDWFKEKLEAHALKHSQEES